LAGAVREPHDREGRNPTLEMGFDLDAAGVESDEGMRDRSCQHPADARREVVTPSLRNRDKTVSFFDRYRGPIESASTLLEEGYSNRMKDIFVAHDCQSVTSPRLSGSR